MQVIGGAEWLSPELARWIHHSGIPEKNILYTSHDSRSQSAAYNRAVENCLAVANRIECGMFVDRDMRPKEEEIKGIFDLPFDFTCARSLTECGDASWRASTDFHSAMWIARVESIAKLGPGPWFDWVTTPSGGRVIGCQCSYFSRKIQAAKMTHGHTGYCDHVPRGGAARPEICFDVKLIVANPAKLL